MRHLFNEKLAARRVERAALRARRELEMERLEREFERRALEQQRICVGEHTVAELRVRRARITTEDFRHAEEVARWRAEETLAALWSEEMACWHASYGGVAFLQRESLGGHWRS